MPTSLTEESEILAKKIACLQTGYEYIAKKIRLFPALFPVHIPDSDRVALNGFVTKGILAGSNSEIAVKEIKHLLKVDYEYDYNDDRNNIGNIYFGEGTTAEFNFDPVLFAAANDQHLTTPELHWTGDNLIVTNLSNAFFYISLYPYPYPVQHATLNPYETEYRYSIDWMVTEYGVENLIVDDLVGVLSLLEAISFFYGEELNINYENIYDKFCLDIINYYNFYGTLKTNDSWFASDYVESGVLTDE